MAEEEEAVPHWGAHWVAGQLKGVLASSSLAAMVEPSSVPLGRGR